jgi:hypothetical protein
MTEKLLGQFHVPSAGPTRRLAASVRRAGQPPAGPPGQATVLSVSAGPPPTCTVSFGDGGDAAPIRYLRSYTPAAGDLVEVAWRNGSPLIIGALA